MVCVCMFGTNGLGGKGRMRVPVFDGGFVLAALLCFAVRFISEQETRCDRICLVGDCSCSQQTNEID